MLRIHYLQQWFGLSDPAMEEALHDVPLYREFAQIGTGLVRLPDETTILRFRHLLKRHDLAVDMLRFVNDLLRAKGLMLRSGTAVDATLISAPSSIKNARGGRDPEMKQTKKGNQWYFGMKAHIGVDAQSGFVHTVLGTAANVHDVTMAGRLLHGEEEVAFGDAGYQGVHKRVEANGPTWHVAMRPGLRRTLTPFIEADFAAERVEKMKARIRARWSIRSGDQASVRVHRGALPRLGQEHGATRHAVCVVEPVDGATVVDGDAGMSASAGRRSRAQRALRNTLREARRSNRALHQCKFTSCSFIGINCTGCTCCAEHP